MPSAFPRHGVWRTYTTAHGLAGLQVMNVVQDTEGYLWIATVPYGLCRFDGQDFRTYTTANGLAGNHVYALLIDRKGRLWVATHDGGLCWYDGSAFRQPRGGGKCNGTRLYEDDRGRIWFVGTTQCGYVLNDRLHDLSEEYVRGKPSGTVLSCFGMAQDGQGNLWIGATGLVRYDGERFHWLATTGGFPEPFLGNIAVGSDGKGGVWVGSGETLFHWDGRRFERRRDHLNAQVSSVCLDRQGRSWICLSRGGALCWDGTQFHAVTPDDGLGHGTITHVHEDHEGLLWFATWGGGVSCYDPVYLRRYGMPAELPAREVQALARDPEGRMWLGCGSAPEMVIAQRDNAAPLMVAQWRDGQVERVPVPAGLLAGPCLATAADTQGRVWLGGTGGAGWYQDGEFHFAHRCPKGLVTVLYASSQGPVYLAWSDIHFGTTHVERHNGPDVEELHSLPGRQWVCAICQTHDGVLWIGLGSYGGQHPGGGIARLTEAGPQYLTKTDGLADDRVEDLLEDSEGRLWVGTWGGLACWDGNEFRRYTTADGLPHNHVRCLHQDPHGDLWMGTDAGVCRRRDRAFQTIRSPEVLATNQILQDPDGSLWFATLHGLVQYTPTAVRPRARVVEVLADRTYSADGAVVVPVSSGQVVFECQGMSFRTPLAGMRYTWRLNDIESEWQPDSPTGRASYAGLAAGNYNFEVCAIDQDFNRSEPASLALRVVEETPQDRPTGEFIGNSPPMREVRRKLLQAAHDDVPVLLLGETGSGKGLAAELVHRNSARGKREMVGVNCSAIADGLEDNELFGHDKEAFTGAVSHRKGWVERADRSTLFLDEVGDLPRKTQGKLFQVLDGKGYQRVGGDRTIQVDVRVIAATNRDLDQMVKKGRFRQDLYHRLTGHRIELPPLRDRGEDIPELATRFLHMERGDRRTAPRVSAEAMRLLEAHDWPGNVRELLLEMRRVEGVCGAELRPEHLSLLPRQTPASDEPEWLTLEERERRYLQAALAKTSGVVKGPRGAAALLQMHEATLRHRLRHHGLR